MRICSGLATVAFLSACSTTTTVHWARYDSEGQCWATEYVTVDKEDFPGWGLCDGGGTGLAVNADGECVYFAPLCGPLEVPGLEPCEVLPGCCERDFPVVNPDDPVCP